MANEHDMRYKKLFSSPRIMQELITSFVHEDWVADLDFSKAERIEASFITDEFLERESDLIWKVWIKDEPVYIYLLTEFQSTVDRFMAVRVLRYICEFYQHLVDTKQLGPKRTLPAVFPLVLYNGDDRWTAPTEIAALIDSRIGSTFMPQFRYFKLAENEFSFEMLEAISNVVGTLFLVESMSSLEVRKNLERIVPMLAQEMPEEVRLFKLWLKNYYGDRENEVVQAIEDVITEAQKAQDLEEIRIMLSTKLKQRDEQVFAEAETKTLQRTAREMYKLGFEIPMIAKITRLTEAELTELFKQPEV